jgi:hypothetical protein
MEIETIEKQGHTCWGLPVFEIDGNEYTVATSEEEADEAVGEYIKESVWSFNSEFIIEHSKLPWEAEEMIKNFQQAKCEDANDTILAIIEDIDVFIQDAISQDGRGHFLASYDDEEISLTDLDFKYWGQVLGALGLGSKDKDSLLLYRIN